MLFHLRKRPEAKPSPIAEGWPARAYYGNRRDEMLQFIPPGTRTLLDVGCGRGAFGSNVKQKLGATVWGIEINTEAARIAAARLDRVIEADIGKALAELPTGHFDCVVFNDVLEHLVDTYDVIDGVRRVLAPRGVVVASLPNVRHFSVVTDLIWRGRWEYADYGILDRTHLRFFTQKNIRELFEDRGYKVEITGINGLTTPLGRFVGSVVPARFRDMQFIQFAAVARPER